MIIIHISWVIQFCRRSVTVGDHFNVGIREFNGIVELEIISCQEGKESPLNHTYVLHPTHL